MTTMAEHIERAAYCYKKADYHAGRAEDLLVAVVEFELSDTAGTALAERASAHAALAQAFTTEAVGHWAMVQASWT